MFIAKRSNRRTNSVLRFCEMLILLYGLLILIQGVSSFCGDNELRCIDGTCVSINKLMDGRPDCPDGKYDEDFNNWCKASQMNCADGTCISRAKFQNGINDCGDNSDEVEFPCKPPLYTCTGQPVICINTSSVGDGVVDCSDGSDEVKQLFDNCVENDECSGNCTCGRYVEHAVCTNDTCVCRTGYKVSANRKRCVTRKLGDVCTGNEDCSVVTNNSQCLEDICKCEMGYIANGSTVCRPVTLGDICTDDGECFMFNNNSRCTTGSCDCNTGYYRNNTLCIRRHIGDFCTTSDDCSGAIDDSACVNETCTCAVGFYSSENLDSCIKRKIQDLCDVDDDCLSVINNSLCQRGACHCEESRKPTTNRTRCTQKLVGDECHFDNNCDLIENSLCIKETCKCQLGFHNYDTNKTCTKRQIFDACAEDVDCSSAVNSSLCDQGICQCESGMITTDNDTVCRWRVLGDHCSDVIDCAASVSYSECNNNSCACVLGYHSPEVNACIRRKIGDDTCLNDDDCAAAVPNSECRNTTCECESGFLEENNGTVCSRRNITSQCGVTTDCSDAMWNSICVNSSCACISGYKSIWNDTACELRALNDICDIDSDCSDAVDNSNCSFGECRCNSGFKSSAPSTAIVDEFWTNSTENETASEQTWLSNTTTEKEDVSLQCVSRFIGDECQVHTDCFDAVPDSLCRNNTCECKQGFKTGSNEFECELNRINDACAADRDCSVAVNNSVCLNGKCKCKLGHQVYSNRTECIRRKIFDTTCSSPIDCFMAVESSTCFKRQCVCNTGYYASNENRTCTKFRIGDENCMNILDCKEAVARSTCRSGECTCIDGYMPVNNNTVCKKRRIGDPCGKDLDCTAAVFRSECNGTCVCIDGYDADPTNNFTTCVKSPKKLLDTCTFDDQCLRLDNISSCGNLHGFESRIKSCVCELGYFVRFDQLEQGQCYSPTNIGDYCENRAWCQFGDNVNCVDNKCTCRMGHIPNSTYNGCIHLPEAVGDFCRIDTHCAKVAHSECYVGDQNNTCQCHYKYRPREDGRECVPRPFVMEPPIPSVEIGVQCDAKRPCNRRDEGRKYWRCMKEDGRQHTRCLCVPGYASRYNSDKFKCEEIQTYYFNINITLEVGCDSRKQDEPLCYQYQPIRVLRQYNNPNTKYFLYIRDRIVLQGFANLFNDTPAYIRDRYVTSEVLNVTELGASMTVGVLLYFSADYFNIINETALQQEIINSLIRSHGEIGKSQLKLSWPFDDAIEYKDFDECTEQDGRFSDCDPKAWCLNTRVSYMCSCRHGYEDWSPDTDGRPGRFCIIPPDVTTDSLSCSDGKCENQWEYISLALVGFGLILFCFIGYEIYTRKKKLEKSDIYFKLQKAAKKAKLKAMKERRKTIKRKKDDDKKKKKTGTDMDQTDEEKHLVETADESNDTTDEG